MRRRRSTKIVATLGPASSTAEQIRALFLAGADVFRLNFSHGTHEDHRERFEIIRALEREVHRPIAILMDLQGPKLRLGRIEGGRAELVKGKRFTLDRDKAAGDATRAPLPHKEIFRAAHKDGALLIDDGKVRLRIISTSEDKIETEVEIGGTISDRKGVNLPDVTLPLSALTTKDRKDLDYGLSLGVDWVALSFVQRASDIAELKKIVAGRAAVCAKMEKPAAIEHLEEIIHLTDALMVARGDLGVELPPEDVPPLQKRMIKAARHAGKPAIVATQMLDSMVHAPTPTRAEASDVATAVYDGADAVMLSAESASGDFPVESVAMMDRIAYRAEQDPLYRRLMDAAREEPEATTADAIIAAARQSAHTLSAAAIVTYTNTGSTALRAARERPDSPLLCLTPKLATARRLALAWGVHAVVIPEDAHNFADMVQKAVRLAHSENFATKGQKLVITAGVPFGTPGATNILRVAFA